MGGCFHKSSKRARVSSEIKKEQLNHKRGELNQVSQDIRKGQVGNSFERPIDDISSDIGLKSSENSSSLKFVEPQGAKIENIQIINFRNHSTNLEEEKYSKDESIKNEFKIEEQDSINKNISIENSLNKGKRAEEEPSKNDEEPNINLYKKKNFEKELFQNDEGTTIIQKICKKCDSMVEKSDLHCLCGICIYCSSCALDIFNKKLHSTKNRPVTCNCGLSISYRLLQNFVIEEDLSSYLSKISSSNFKTPKKFNCKCGTLKEKIDRKSFFHQCEQCSIVYCLRCLEEHDQSFTCKKYFNSTIPKCKICKVNKIVDHSCKCPICEKCYYQSVKEQILDFPLDLPSCPSCKIKIPKFELFELFGNQTRFIKFQEDSMLTTRFNCPICFMDKVVDGSCTLYCGDRYCSKCMKEYIESSLNILPSNLTTIACPKCEKEISYHIINSLISKEALERYYKRLVKNAKLIDNQEVLKFCNQCDYGALVQIDIKQFDCPVCNKSICAKCNKPFKENCCKNERIDVDYSGSFKDFIASCPKCNSQIMKETGCNFLQCPWPGCTAGFFCFLCKKELKVEDHYSHYKLTGPFGNSCNTLDGI